MYEIDARTNDMGRLIEEQVKYVIDATKYGNVSRFINHRQGKVIKYWTLQCEQIEINLLLDS